MIGISIAKIFVSVLIVVRYLRMNMALHWFTIFVCGANLTLSGICVESASEIV